MAAAPRKTTDDRLNASRIKFEKVKAELARLEARKKTEDRRADARRKFVVGAAALAYAERDPVFRNALRGALKVAVTRETDKDVIADIIDG